METTHSTAVPEPFNASPKSSTVVASRASQWEMHQQHLRTGGRGDEVGQLGGGQPKVCSQCGTTNTPCWRRGPNGTVYALAFPSFPLL